MTSKSNKAHTKTHKPLKHSVAYFKQAVEDYIKTCTDDKGNIYKEPMLIELALIMGIPESTLFLYRNRPLYTESIKRISKIGEIFLNRTMEADKANQNAMFKLKTRHGYIEQQKLDITTANQPLGIIQLPSR